MTPPTRVPDTLPVVAPAPQHTAVAPAPPQRQGDWVINLASYKNQSYAARKQAEFANKGVMVEQVRAEVAGKTIYRLCVPGFVSSRAASTEAMAIRTRLGLSDTWIARH
jgi:cell division protein FtsN